MIVVLMGVMGSGKTTIGTRLADLMQTSFVDADDHHPAANAAKMKAGHPLDDADRAPWLEALNGLLRQWSSTSAGGVLACSALKEKYREILRMGMPQGTLRFVLLEAPQQLLIDRIGQRQHAFMNPNLLTSQLETLEKPNDALVIINDRPPDEIAHDILRQLLP